MLLVVLATLLVANPAATLDYNPGPEAPPRDALVERVSARLGYDPFAADSNVHLSVEFAVRRDDCEARVERWGDFEASGSWRRSASRSACNEVFEELTLAVALAVDPLLGAARESKSTSSAVIASSATEPIAAAPVLPLPDVATTTSAPGLRPAIRAGLLLTLGLVPSAMVGVGIAGELRADRFSVDVEIRATLPMSARVDAALFEHQLVAAVVAICTRASWFAGCVNSGIGALDLEGENLAPNRNDTAFFLAAGLSALADLEVTKNIALRGRLDLDANLNPAVVASRGSELWRQPRFFSSVAAFLVYALDP